MIWPENARARARPRHYGFRGGSLRRPPRGNTYIAVAASATTMTAAAMATIATVEMAKNTG
jgi:hypothetical protein